MIDYQKKIDHYRDFYELDVKAFVYSKINVDEQDNFFEFYMSSFGNPFYDRSKSLTVEQMKKNAYHSFLNYRDYRSKVNLLAEKIQNTFVDINGDLDLETKVDIASFLRKSMLQLLHLSYYYYWMKKVRENDSLRIS